MKHYLKATFAGISLLVAIIWLSFPFGRAYIDSFGNFLSERDGIWQSVRQTYQDQSRMITSDAISDTVKIDKEKNGILHVYAQNKNDALWGMGYAMAAERSFQLFLMADMSAGQISTWFGDKYLETDKAFLNLGLEEKAWQIHNNLSDEEYALISRYQNGINAYINNEFDKEKSFEFRMMELRRRYFRPVDVIRIYLFWQYLRSYSTHDIKLLKALKVLGKQEFERYYGLKQQVAGTDSGSGSGRVLSYTRSQYDTVDDYLRLQQKYRQQLLPHDEAPLEITSLTFPSIVNGERHHVTNISTPFIMPSLFAEVRLTTPQLDIYGLALPGIPGLIFGSNNHISWSQSASDTDPVDFYPVSGPLQDYRKEFYKIKSRTGKEVNHQVYFGEHGVIIHVDTLLLTQYWKGYEYNGQIGALWSLNNTTTLKNAAHLVQNGIGLATNFLISDHTSTAIVQTGCRNKQIQIGRQKNKVDLSGECEKETIKITQGPAAIQSINDNDNETFWKQRRLNDLLSTHRDVDKKQVTQLSKDVQLAHKILFDILGNQITFNKNTQLYDFFEQARQWQFKATSDSKITVILDRFMVSLRDNIWDELEGLPYPPDQRWVELLESNPAHSVFDLAHTAKRESAIDMLKMSLKEALNYTIMEFGSPNNWNWGNITRIETQHISGLPVFNKFSSFTLQHDGYNGTIFSLPSRFKNKGSTWQLITHIQNNQPQVRAIGLSGNSSNPFNPEYHKQLKLWQNEQFITVNLKQQKVGGSLTVNLIVKPETKSEFESNY